MNKDINNVNIRGCLYVVATPIGNMGDITARAIEMLTTVDIIYAEDTRQTAKLLRHFGIENVVYQLHKHNEEKQKYDIAHQLELGNNIAIVSDAGTPLIADPGYATLAYLRELQHAIYVIPGCSSVIAALSISGLPSDRFQFAGFIPSKPKQRQDFLSTYQYSKQTTVFFETPHRIKSCLYDCLAIYGEQRRLFIGRELTKQFEDTILLPLAKVPQWLAENDKRQKGEFVLILEPSKDQAEIEWQGLARMMLSHNVSTKTIAKVVSEYAHQPKKIVYQFVLQIQKDN